MRGDEGLEDRWDRPSLKAAVAGIAAGCAAALAAGVLDGAPQGRARGQAAVGHGAGQAVADGGRNVIVAPPLPDPRLCFRGPLGEPVDFPAAQQHCGPQATGGAGLRLASARP